MQPEVAALRVRDLFAGYGGPPVLQGVSLDLWPGKLTALLGSNGSGKTTLLRAICGVIDVKGRVDIHGTALVGKSTERIARLGVSHVPEGRGTFVDLTVEENLRVGGFARESPTGLHEAMERVYSWLPRLVDRRKQRAGSLSGGEQQMLAIGRALIAEPRVLLLDEPSFGLAPRITEEVMTLLRRLQQQSSLAIMLVEQNANAALGVAQYAYVLRGGRIAASGTSEEIRAGDAVHAAYLGNMK